MGLFISTALEISLRLSKIHPDDFDSAEDWAFYYSWPLNSLAGFEFLAYFCLIGATNWNTLIRITKVELPYYQLIFGIGVLVHVVVLPLLLYWHLILTKKIGERRQFHSSVKPSSVRQALELIDSSFAELYGQTFDAAKIDILQLKRLTTDHLLGMRIPLGDAIRMLDVFYTFKIPKHPTEFGKLGNPSDDRMIEIVTKL